MKSNKTKIKLHPYCELFPALSPDEASELAKSVAARGLRDPIVTFEGMVLDGQNRLSACLKTGVPMRFEEFKGTTDEALDFVVDRNLSRRHLSDSQRALLAAEIANLKQGQKAKVQTCTSVSQASARLHVSPRSVKSAIKVMKSATSAVKSMVRDGNLSVSAAAQFSKLPRKSQAKVTPKGAQAVVRKVAKMRAKGGLAAEAAKATALRGGIKGNYSAHPERVMLDAYTSAKPVPIPNAVLPPEAAAAVQVGTVKITDRETACEAVLASYRDDKAWFNRVPPPSPMDMVDRIVSYIRNRCE